MKKKDSKELKKGYGIKIILVGETGVGKTQILYRYARGEFHEKFASTIGSDFETCIVELDNKIFKLTILDTAGQEKFRSITRGYFTNVPCAVIVYDITDEDSFQAVKKWIYDCQSYGPKSIHLVLVANKIDLKDERKVSEEKGKQLADDFKMDYIETSAKTGENIENIFKGICEFINKNIDEGKYDFDDLSHGVKLLINQDNLKADKFIKLEGNNNEGNKNNSVNNKNKGCCK